MKRKEQNGHDNSGKRGWLRLMAAACAALVILALMPTAQAAEYITAQELYEQTRDGWHADYTAPPHEKFGGIPEPYAFRVDVALEMPPVDRVPILDVVINHDIFQDETTEVEKFNKKQVRNDGTVISNTMHGWDEDGEPYGIFFNAYTYPVRADQQAENNPFMPEEAETFFQELVRKYFGKEELLVTAVAGSVVTPEVPSWADESFHEMFPPLEKGSYQLQGYQTLDGIPLLASASSWRRYFPSVTMDLIVIDPGTYRLQGTSFSQVGVVHEDVPLLPWSDIQQAFEAQCLAENRMYNVYSARFGYQLTLTRDGPNTGYAGYDGERKTYPEETFTEIYTVRPVWVIRGFAPVEIGGMMQEEQIESQQRALESQDGFDALFGYSAMLINAQTGELINHDSDLDRLDSVFPEILTWEDVR